MLVKSDSDVLKTFSIHSGIRDILVYVGTSNHEEPIVKCQDDVNYNVNMGIDNEEGATKYSSENEDEGEDAYGHEYGNEPEEEEEEHVEEEEINEEEEQVGEEEETKLPQSFTNVEPLVDEEVVKNVDTNPIVMSDYGSKDESTSESNAEIDSEVWIKGAKKQVKGVHGYYVGKEFEVSEGKEIVLARGLLFDNIHKFREMLRDFTIQEGFKIMRIKNENISVTCCCAAVGCP